MIQTIYRRKLLKADDNGLPYWEDAYCFFQGDHWFEPSDWRVVEVPGKKMDVEFIGVAEVSSFPVQYPLILRTGQPIYPIEIPITYVQ